MWADVVLIAERLHWPPDAILDLPHADRRRVLALLGRPPAAPPPLPAPSG